MTRPSHARDPSGGRWRDRLRAIRRSLVHAFPVERTGEPASMASWFRSVVLDRIIPSINAFVEARTLQVWLLALIIGAGVAYAAILFRTLIGLVQLAWLGTMHESVVTAAAYVPWPVILLAPAAGGLVIGYLLQNHVPGRRAHGVADVIEARALRDCQMQTRTGLWSALISAISIGCGASVGREGPVVHLGATIASAIENYMQLPAAARRTLLAAGVAAAVSASFNAPMAGVLFACEVILRHYAMSAFVPIVIASVAGTAIARMHLGDFPAFIIPQYQITSYLEFPAFVLLGLTCAAVAILFQSSLMVTERLLWGIRMPLWVRPMIGGFAVGLIALAFPHVLGVGYEATDMALKQQLPLLLLLALLVAKTAATAISLASRFGGGVFSPSLYLGAMAGGAFGIIAESIVPQAASSNGLYAILGMGGVAAAVLGAPISTTMIVFELTEGYAMAIAILLTVSIANGATIAVLGESFFHWQLATRGLFLGEGPHKEIMRKLTVRDFARLVPADDAEERRRAPDDQGPWLLMGDTVESALRAFDRSGEQIIPIVHDNDIHRVIGHAYHVDALHIYNRALVEAHVEEHR